MADKKSKPGNGMGRTPTYQTAYHGDNKTNPLTNLARIIVEKFDKRRVPENTISAPEISDEMLADILNMEDSWSLLWVVRAD